MADIPRSSEFSRSAVCSGGSVATCSANNVFTTINMTYQRKVCTHDNIKWIAGMLYIAGSILFNKVFR